MARDFEGGGSKRRYVEEKFGSRDYPGSSSVTPQVFI
jgi:hypothetical protein